MDQTQQRQVLDLTCPNVECKRNFKIYRPEKPGMVKITCPGCKQAFQFRIEAQQSAVDHSADPEKTVTLDQTPDDIYRFSCPHCGNNPITAPVKGKNLIKATCKNCMGRISLVIDRPAPATELGDGEAVCDFTFLDEDAPKINAVLRVFTKRRFLPDVKVDFPIVKGSYFIGRNDPDNQPDIPLNGDTTVSRRSVQIEVINGKNPGECLYPFTVIKATNPVTVNGKRLRAGESVFLNFNDRITMGKTELVFMAENGK